MEFAPGDQVKMPGMVQMCTFCEPTIKWKYLDLYLPVLQIMSSVLCLPCLYTCVLYVAIEFRLLFHEITFLNSFAMLWLDLKLLSKFFYLILAKQIVYLLTPQAHGTVYLHMPQNAF